MSQSLKQSTTNTTRITNKQLGSKLSPNIKKTNSTHSTRIQSVLSDDSENSSITMLMVSKSNPEFRVYIVTSTSTAYSSSQLVHQNYKK